ncbi:MAG: PAS domain S-box protein, partial [Thermoanaerobaculales bacterium]
AEIVATALTDASGRVTSLLGVTRDITERKRVEKALRESEERFRQLAETMPDAVVVGQDGRNVYANSAAARLLRAAGPEELVGLDISAIVHPAQYERARQQMQRTLAGEPQTPFEDCFVRLDGSLVPVEIAVSLLTWQGRPALQVVVRDITERKRAEEALQESEERYRSLFEQSPIGIYRTTPDGRILLANPALLQMLGYASMDELSTRNLEETGFQPEYQRQQFKDAVERTGELRGFEAVWTTKDGRKLLVHENAHAIRGADGTILYYEGAVEDITAEREAREALRRSDAQYRHLFESANDAILVFEPESETILDTNAKACELYGFTRDELIGTSLKRLTLDVARGEKRMTELRRSNHVQDFETVHLRRDGTLVDLEVSASAVDYGGRPAVLGTARDITQRKRSEEERRRLVAAIEQAAEAVLITDSGGGVLYVNPAFERITGYRPDEVIGLNPRLLKSGKQAPSFYAEMWTTITHGSVWTGRLSNRRKDGSLYEEEMSISPVRDDGGTIINFVAVKRDVTREVELQQQLNQSQKMEAVGQLAGGVAHDFNNLLQAMLSLTEILIAHRADPERVAADAVELEQQVKHGTTLARQLLLFSRRETARPETLDLNEVVREAGKLLRRLLRANIAVESRLAEGKLPIEADRGQLEQVLFNLAVNGADAMPGGGRLMIATGSEGGEVWLQVADTGGGVPVGIRERIFEPFFTTKRKGKGTGLGLAVVHGIVAQHGGRIGLESREGQGTTFTITLPRAGSGEHAAVKLTELAGEAPGGRGERLLLVEDEAAARNALTEILTLLGYEVVAVGSGEEAERLPPEPVFDVLLTDLMLPGVAGPQVAAGLKERWPKLKVILMSGYTEDEAMRHGINAGTVRFLQKPFDMTTIAREIRAALGSD